MTIKQEAINDTINYLKNLRLGSTPSEPKYGICSNLKTFLDSRVNKVITKNILCKVYNLSHTWSKYSGDDTYPVPDPEGVDPEDKYDITHNKWTGCYGDLRRELCLYLAEELQKGN